MTDLTDFLLARIAEDEGRAERWREEWRINGGVIDLTVTPGPARVLAECEAKRRIVNMAVPSGWTEDGLPLGSSYVEGWWDALTSLASVYADHSEYDESWKPED